MKALERLINYVTVRTPSDEESETVPSSVCQFDLARKLLTKLDFPEELVLNRSADAIKEYVNRRF